MTAELPAQFQTGFGSLPLLWCIQGLTLCCVSTLWRWRGFFLSFLQLVDWGWVQNNPNPNTRVSIISVFVKASKLPAFSGNSSSLCHEFPLFLSVGNFPLTDLIEAYRHKFRVSADRFDQNANFVQWDATGFVCSNFKPRTIQTKLQTNCTFQKEPAAKREYFEALCRPSWIKCILACTQNWPCELECYYNIRTGKNCKGISEEKLQKCKSKNYSNLCKLSKTIWAGDGGGFNTHR